MNNNRQTALITGASRGIGRAIAIALSETDLYDVIAITCLSNNEKLMEVKSIIEANGKTCIAKCLDVSSFDECKSFIEEISSEYSISLLINNAAISYVGLLIDMTKEDWDNSINVNLNSVFNTCRLVVPNMIRNQQNQVSRIINISSVWGLVGASCEVCYSATKGAVNSFTKALAKELAPSNIAVNAIAFGAVDTEMNSHLSEEEKASLCEEIPSGSFLSPSDAAKTVIKLIEMPAYLTGEIIKVDGGWI